MTRTALFESTLQEAAQLHSHVGAPPRLELWGRHGAKFHAECKLALAGPVWKRSRLVRRRRRCGEEEGKAVATADKEETHQLAAGHSKHPRVSQLHLCCTVTQNLWQ